MLEQNLSELPVHDEIRGALRTMIARGADPLEVAEAAQAVAAALSIAVEGEARTGAKLYAVSIALLRAADPHGDRPRSEIH